MTKKIIPGIIILTGLFLVAIYALILTRETSMIMNYKDSGVIQSEVSFHGDSAIVFVKIDTADYVTRPVPAVGDTLYKIEDSLASRILFRDNFYTPRPPGTIKVISFISGTDTIAATMQTSRAKTGEVILFLVLTLFRLLTAFAYIGLGFWALAKRPDSGGVRALVLFSFSMAALMAFFINLGLDNYTTLKIPFRDALSTIMSTFGMLFGTFWLNLQLLFPEPKKFIKERPALTYILIYVPTLTLFILARIFSSDTIAYLLVPLGIGQISLGFVLLAREGARTKNPLIKRQVRLVSWGSGIGLGYFLLMILSGIFFKDHLKDLSEVFIISVVLTLFTTLLMSPLSFAYAFGRYRLLEVEGRVRRTTRYLAVFVLILLGLLVVIYFVNSALVTVFGTGSNLPVIIIALLLVIGFATIQGKIKSSIDRWIYPERSRLRNMLQDFLGNALFSSDRNTFWKELQHRLKQTLNVDIICPVLQAAEGGTYTVYGGDITPFTDKSDFINEVSKNPRRPVMRDEVIAADIVSITDPEKDWFEQNKIAVVLPMATRAELKGFLAIGYKAENRDFEPADFEILQLLTSQVAMADENMRLLEDNVEKKRLEGEMQIARQVQEGMLPHDLPETPGLEVAARSLFCYEVAGDYYDIARVDDDRTVLAIGDVSGKGAGAALLMSNLQASFRTTVEMDIPLTRMVTGMNELIYRNSQPDQFITFFVCIYDRSSRRLTYVNAGHNPPYLFGRDGRIEELTDGGILLGAAPGMSYQMGQKQLQPDDCLFLFTDGLSEAWSEQDEMYGEQRIVEFLKKHCTESSASILTGLEADVKEFIGTKPLLDDFTVIVARVDG